MNEDTSLIDGRVNMLESLFKQHKHLGSDMTQPLPTTPISTLGTTGAITIAPTRASVYTITPTGSMSFVTKSFPSELVTFVFKTSGTTSYTMDFQTGFTTLSTLTTGTVSGIYKTITFVGDGLNLREISRTAALTQY